MGAACNCQAQFGWGGSLQLGPGGWGPSQRQTSSGSLAVSWNAVRPGGGRTLEAEEETRLAPDTAMQPQPWDNKLHGL